MEKEYDLFLFCGQSNMAGRGITSGQWPEKAPVITPGGGLGIPCNFGSGMSAHRPGTLWGRGK